MQHELFEVHADGDGGWKYWECTCGERGIPVLGYERAEHEHFIHELKKARQEA